MLRDDGARHAQFERGHVGRTESQPAAAGPAEFTTPRTLIRARPLNHVYIPPWYRRHPWSAAGMGVFLALVVIDAVRAGRFRRDDDARYHDRTFAVVGIVDAETIEIDAPDVRRPYTTVRLLGVDASAASRARDEAERQAARAFVVRELMGRSAEVVLYGTHTRDADGRLVAYVYLPGEASSFNARLISAGHAGADAAIDHPLASEFARLQKEVRRRRESR